MRLTYAPILFLQVQLFAIVWVTLYGWKKRLLCRQTRFPHVDFTPRTLTMESLSSDNLGASGVERHMWAPTKLHQHWSAAALCGDVLPCNTLLDFFVLSHTLLFVTHYQNPGKKSTNRRVWKQNYQRGHRAEYRAVTSGSINLNTVSFSPFLFQQQQWETELWDPMCANFTI